MPPINLTKSLLLSTTTAPTAAAKPLIYLSIQPGKIRSSSFLPSRRRHHLCSVRVGLLTGSGRAGGRSGGPMLANGAKLGPIAHVRTPRATARIKPHLPFRSPSSSFITKPINYTEKASPCLFSSHCPLRSSSSDSSTISGPFSSSSGLVADQMGHEGSRNDVAWCQNGEGPPPALSSSSSFSKEKEKNGSDRFDKHKRSEEEKECTKLLTLPTLLTLGRVAAIPVFVGTFYVNSQWGTVATTIIFIAAAITDWLDGYLARKMHLGTAFGAFLDPVADKLMVATTLVLLCSRPLEVSTFGNTPWLFPIPSIAIIGREITMSAVREWAASQNGKLSEAVAVNNLGKWKTATQMIALTILLACRDSSFDGPQVLVASGVVLLYISAWLAVWSLFVYMRKIWRVLLR